MLFTDKLEIFYSKARLPVLYTLQKGCMHNFIEIISQSVCSPGKCTGVNLKIKINLVCSLDNISFHENDDEKVVKHVTDNFIILPSKVILVYSVKFQNDRLS